MHAAGNRPHAALLASPGMGHLIPVLELGKRLVTHHDIHVTIFVVATDAATTDSLLKSCPATITNLSIVPLPAVDVSGHVEPSDHIVTKLLAMMRHSIPNLRSAISAMPTPPTALVVDIFGTGVFPLADELGMLKYAFDTTTAWFLATAVYGSSAEDAVARHIGSKTPLEVPGCRPVRFDDTLDSYHAIGDRVYRDFQRVGAEFTTADGILVNTWEEMEGKTLDALRDRKAMKDLVRAPVYPVGPLVRPSPPLETTEPNDAVLWLDQQPDRSVIYVSFGSGGTLPLAQLVELAWGLELSGQRFVWVVRPPPVEDDDVSATFFSLGNGSQGGPHHGYLPEGFLSRTRDRGLVVPMWAPQAEILAHPAVSGFLSHCGWNSTLESITNGVPMVAWPLYAEQKLNAALLTDELQVAVRPESDSAGSMVRREEIEKLVRRVMVAEEEEERVAGLKESGERALSRKLKGSSYSALAQVARELELNHQRVVAKAQGGGRWGPENLRDTYRRARMWECLPLSFFWSNLVFSLRGREKNI
ncbi:unnamed protein product [Linum tenue]|uniref:Glycosyltransferase n=1 Tax=Linum tenue TaxID=586396 RepID=A0AAV0PTN6_9ROSI|nr:unnamed protein product [Linum tenue]